MGIYVREFACFQDIDDAGRAAVDQVLQLTRLMLPVKNMICAIDGMDPHVNVIRNFFTVFAL